MMTFLANLFPAALLLFSIPYVVGAKTPTLSRSISSKIHQKASPNRRRTQAAEEQTCTPQVIFKDDEDSLEAFANKFGPSCACSSREEFDFEAFFVQNPSPANATDLNELQVWIDAFNAYLGELRSSETKGCSNQCSACFSPETDNYCVTIQNEMTSSTLAGNVKNFTFADMAAFASDPDSVEESILAILRVFESSSTGKECYTFTQGGTGTVCLTYQFELSSEEGIEPGDVQEVVSTQAEMACTLSVDDVDCQSCQLNMENDCIVADCTNIASAPAMLDFCTPDAAPPTEGVYLPIYDAEVLELETEGVGACPEAETTATTTTPATTPATGMGEPAGAGTATGGTTTAAVPEPATTTTATPGTTPVVDTTAPVVDTTATVATPTDAPVAVPQTTTEETPPMEREVAPGSGALAPSQGLIVFLVGSFALVNYC